MEEVDRLLEARIASARSNHEREKRAMVKEQEALEEVREEAVAALEEATRLGEISRWRAAELLARERLVRAWEEAIVPRENAVETSWADLAAGMMNSSGVAPKSTVGSRRSRSARPTSKSQ